MIIKKLLLIMLLNNSEATGPGPLSDPHDAWGGCTNEKRIRKMENRK